MKKIIISACALALSCGLLFGCASEEAAETTETTATEAAAEDKVTVTETGVAMQQIAVADAKANAADYVFVDVRKAADFQAGHIDGALSADMDPAVSNKDYDTAVANMQAIEKNIEGKKVILVCYKGKVYAQAGTDVLNAMGFDMANVYTLEGGMEAWGAAENTAAAKAETPKAEPAATTSTEKKTEDEEAESSGGACDI